MGQRLLLVDDDPADRLLYKSWLTRAGYQVVEACDGEEGMMLCMETAPSCIIVDFLMRHKDGFQLMIELRKQMKSETPIIFMTGYDSQSVRDDALQMGANQFMSKHGLTSQSLCAMVDDVLAGAQVS